jgi:hypothetical protein
LLSGVIGGFGGVLARNPLAPSCRINACARPGCIPIIGLLPSGFRAPRDPGCLETAYPTIQQGIGQTGIVEPELNVSVSTIVDPERAGAAFSSHGDPPCICLSNLPPGQPLARSGRRP